MPKVPTIGNNATGLTEVTEIQELWREAPAVGDVFGAGPGGDVSIGTGSSYTLTPGGQESPAALEKKRLETAEARMHRFCLDLNELVGREILDIESEDRLTRDIYEAAIEADVDVEEVMSSGSEWLERMPMALARLARRIPNAEPTRRVRQLVEGEVRDLEDPDAQLALEHAGEYFKGAPRPVPGYVTALAVCLLEYGFRKPTSRAVAIKTTSTDILQDTEKDTLRADVESEFFVRTSTDFTRAEIETLQEILEDGEKEAAALGLEELRGQRRLGGSIKLAATVICGVGLLATGKILWFPMLLVAYVMAYCLIDRRAIREKKRQLALETEKEKKDSDARDLKDLHRSWRALSRPTSRPADPPGFSCDHCGGIGTCSDGRCLCDACGAVTPRPRAP